MNYMAEIKAFYDRLELNPQPNQAIALWHALMSIANKAGWPDTFTVASSVLGLRSGLNASALKRARNKLAQDGFIKWKPRGGNLSAQYTMVSLVAQNQRLFEPQTEPQTEPQVEPQTEPQDEPIIRHRQKQNTVSLRACEHFEEFWQAYPKKVSRLIAEQAYMQLVVSGISEAVLIDCAKNYAESCRLLNTGEQFIKQPGNWLNDSTWLDYAPENYKKPKSTKEQNKNKFTSYPQRSYDYAALEKQLISRGMKGSDGT